MEIFAILKSKTFVGVVPTEARKGTVKEFIKKHWGKQLQRSAIPAAKVRNPKRAKEQSDYRRQLRVKRRERSRSRILDDDRD